MWRTTLANIYAPDGIAVDGSGNVFVAVGSQNAVYEILAAGGYTTVKTLGSGFSSPLGIAVDGNGNVFVADHGNNAVKEILAVGGYTTVKTLGGGFHIPQGVAVDGSGNVFVAADTIQEILAVGGYTTVKTLGSGFYEPFDVAVDATGNVFVADLGNSAVKEILAASGYATVNTLGSGFYYPEGVAVDGSGNVFVTDQSGSAGAVKEMAAAGDYTTVKTLGGGFNFPYRVAVDGSGNVFVADSGNMRVVELVAGTVDFGTIAIGQTSATIPLTFTFDTNGTLGSFAALNGGSELDFATASGGSCVANTAYAAGATCTVNASFVPKSVGLHGGAVVLLDSSGNTIATAYLQGTGATGSGGPATLSSITVSPASATIPLSGTQQFTATGTFTDSSTQDLTGTVTWTSSNISVATINASGLATAVTGGNSDISASLNGVFSNSTVLAVESGSYTAPTEPVGIASGTQTATILLSSSFTLRSISVVTQGAPNLDFNLAPGGTCNVGTAYTSGQICTVNFTFTPLAPGQRLGAIVLLDGSGKDQATEYISGIGTGPVAVLVPGIINTVAGNGQCCYNGDGIPATGAEVNPFGVAVDSSGNIYIQDPDNQRIRKVSASTGLISTVAGTGTSGYNGDGIPATGAALYAPTGIALDSAGNLYISDFGNFRIRKVTASTGLISTVAGNGTQGYNGDNISATSAEIYPYGVALDSAGNIYIADDQNYRIRKVSASTGLISTIAGTGTFGYNGDGIAATSAEIVPIGVALDGAGNLYIVDGGNMRIREVSAITGLISTVAGNGTCAEGADNVSATSTALCPSGITLDNAGNIYIADGSDRIRKVSASTGLISTVAGNGQCCYNGDGIPATSAEIYAPVGVGLDSAGNIYIADENNNRIRKVSDGATSLNFASTSVGSTSSDSPQTVTLWNNGTTPLTFSIPSSGNNPSISTSFTLNSSGGTACPLVGSTASSVGTLAAGASCTLSISFVPTAAGSLSGSLVLTDNNLGVTNATQTISLSGTATGSALITPTVTVTPTSLSITTAQALSVTIAVSGGTGNPTPTGTVTLGFGAGPWDALLVNGSTTFNIPAGSLATGAVTLTVSYTPDSNSTSTYNTARGSCIVTVTNPGVTTPTVTVTPSSSSITTLQSLSVAIGVGGTPTPTGTVALAGGGYTSAATTLTGGSATINIPAGSLDTGSDPLTATYTPDASSSSTYNGATGSSSVTVTTPAKTTPTVTVTPSASSIPAAQGLSVAVAVSGGTGNPTPTGSVTLSGGGYTSPATTLTSGSTTFNIPAGSLSTGSDTLTASYTPDSSSSSTYNSSTGSSSLTVSASGTGLTEPVGTASSTQTATVLLSSSFTLQSISVVTQGAPNLDFRVASGGTCTVGTTYTAGQTCAVNFTFTPKAPGQRMGAILLLDGSDFVHATEYISGTGTGPQISFSSGSQSAISGFSSPMGVTTDASGYVYVADNSGISKFIPSSGAFNMVYFTGFNKPTGVAVDGSGNVFVADSGNNAIKVILVASGSAPYSTLGSNFNSPWAVAVDASGNVFVADSGNNAVKEILAASGYTTVNTLGSGFSSPKGIALDGAGNVFVGDSGNNAVKEILAASGYTTVNTLGSGFSTPMGVAVDPSGNVLVADAGNNAVKEIIAASGYTTVNTLASGFSAPSGVAVDGSGNVFVADSLNNHLVKLDLSDAPSLGFASTAVGSTSSDSPKTVTLENNGNTALTFPIPSSGNNPSISPNFTLNSSGGTACPFIGGAALSAGTLAVGASCTLPISFVPTAVGSLSGSLVLTDNNLNVPNATQTISLSGTGTGGTVNTTASLGSSQNPSSYGQSVTITATVSATSGTATPTGTVQFSVDGSPAGSAVTLSGGTAAYATSTLAAGAHSITAVYTPGTGSAFITSSATALSQVVNKATSSVTTWPTASSITYGQTLASSTLTGGVSTPAGSFAFTTPTTTPNAGTASQSVTFTPTDATDYSTLTGTAGVTVPKPALPQVPGERACQVAGRALGRTVARSVLPRRLHSAAFALCSCSPEQAATL